MLSAVFPSKRGAHQMRARELYHFPLRMPSADIAMASDDGSRMPSEGL